MRVRNSHIALPRQPTQRWRFARLCSRDAEGASPQTCRVLSGGRQLPSVAIQKEFLSGGQESRDCESRGKDKESVVDGAETKDIRTPRRNANIPIRVIVHIAMVHHVHRVHRVHRVHITIHTVSVLCGQSRNLLITPADTQDLVSHALPRIRVRFRQFYLCGRRFAFSGFSVRSRPGERETERVSFCRNYP